MQFQTPLVRATLIRRYKRFLADILLPDGREVVAHCANPGAMTGLAEPGTIVWAEPNDDPKKKLDWAWKLAELPGGHFACVDTGLANRVVEEALQAGRIKGLAGYAARRREVPYGEASRVDFLLTGASRRDAYVEVKSVTLKRRGDLAEFPDTVTKRGARHLDELAAMVAAGQRAVLLYLVMRTDCAEVAVAGDIDPAYGTAFARANTGGVEMLAISAQISPAGIMVAKSLPVIG